MRLPLPTGIATPEPAAGCHADRFGSACLHLTTGMGAAHSSQNQEPAPWLSHADAKPSAVAPGDFSPRPARPLVDDASGAGLEALAIQAVPIVPPHSVAVVT